MVIEMRLDAYDLSAIPVSVAHAEDVCVGSTPGIGEPEKVFQEFGALIVGRLREGILTFLEIEREALGFMKELLEE